MLEVNIYTDGACRGNPGPGGYGVVLSYKDQEGQQFEKELSQGYQETTNNRMELLGVLRGLQSLKKPCKVTVFTDSQYIVNSFNQKWLEGWIKNNWRRGPKKEAVKNSDLWKLILAAMETHDVTYVWVKGHDGHEQNERCDVLATTAADGKDLLEDTGNFTQ